MFNDHNRSISGSQTNGEIVLIMYTYLKQDEENLIVTSKDVKLTSAYLPIIYLCICLIGVSRRAQISFIFYAYGQHYGGRKTTTGRRLIPSFD